MLGKAAISIGLILAYFVINAIIIKVMGRKQENLEDYAVGNRSFGWLLNSFSYIGGWYCGTTYTGWFSNAATIGVFAQYVIIYSITSLVIMFLMAKPVWRLGKIYGLETQGDLIELRYGSKKFKWIFSLLTMLFWAPWLIIEIKTIGYVVQAATYYSIGFNIGMIFVSLFVIAYSFLGGARASAVGGLVQGITFTIVGVIAIYWLLVQAYGGIGEEFNLVETVKPELLTLQEGLNGKYWFGMLLTCTLAGYILPGIFVSIYRADSSRAVKKSVLIAPTAGILIGASILVCGLGAATFPDFPEDPQAGAFWLGGEFGGPVMVGLIGILALAASMSTISAVINCMSVLISKDLIQTVNPKIGRDKLFKYARIFTIAAGIIAIIIAMCDIPNLMFIALMMYDCSIQAFPAIFIGLWWKRANLPGVFIGFCIGSFFSIMGNLAPATIAWAGGWSGGMIGFFFNMIAVVICGLLIKPDGRWEKLTADWKGYKEDYSGKLI